MLRKFISLLTLVCFFSTTLPVQAQSVSTLPASGYMLSLTNSFRPTLFKGLKVYPENPFRIDFLVDNGQSFSEEELPKESTTLAQYFLAVLTTPAEDLWVNLSPVEKDRIIPEALGQTIMGRDLLSQDYILKQLTASLMYPENATGRELWEKIHQTLYEQTGSSEIPEDLLHKIWIVPERAVVQEDGALAYVKEAKMKVLLEEDVFVREQSVGAGSKPALIQGRVTNPPLQNNIKSIIRSILIPVIEQEINEGENFVQLRQIFHSMVLATWFKRKIQESILGESYADQNKIAGVESGDIHAKWAIYERYLEAFKGGLYDIIREDYDPATQSIIPRRYFTGGAGFEHIDSAMVVEQAPIALDQALLVHQFLLDPINADGQTFNAAMMTKEQTAVDRLLADFDGFEKDYKNSLLEVLRHSDVRTALHALEASDQKMNIILRRARLYTSRKSLQGTLSQEIFNDYQERFSKQHQTIRDFLVVHLANHWPENLQNKQYASIKAEAEIIWGQWLGEGQHLSLIKIYKDLREPQSKQRYRKNYRLFRGEIYKLLRQEIVAVTQPRFPASQLRITAYTDLILGEIKSGHEDVQQTLLKMSSYLEGENLNDFKIRELVTYWQQGFMSEASEAQMKIFEQLLVDKIGKDVRRTQWRRSLNNISVNKKTIQIVLLVSLLVIVFNNVDFSLKKIFSKKLDDRESFEGASQDAGNPQDSLSLGETSQEQAEKILNDLEAFMLNPPQIDGEKEFRESLKTLRQDTEETQKDVQQLERQEVQLKQEQKKAQEQHVAIEQKSQQQLDSLLQVAEGLDEESFSEDSKTIDNPTWHDPVSMENNRSSDDLSPEDKSSRWGIKMDWLKKLAGLFLGWFNVSISLEDAEGLGDEQTQLGDGNITAHLEGFQVKGGNGYLQRGKFTRIDPVNGKRFVEESDFQEWTGDVQASEFEEYLVIKTSKTRVHVFLPPGYVPTGVKTENPDVQRFKIHYDHMNGMWQIVFDHNPKRIQVGMRPARDNELPGIDLIEVTDPTGKGMDRKAAKEMIRENVPSKIWEILQKAKDLPDKQKESLRRKLMSVFAYSTNPFFNDSDENMLKTMFQVYAGECEGLSMMEAVFSYVLDLPIEIHSGFSGAGTSWRGHAWAMIPGGIEESTQYVSVTSPFYQKKGVTKEQWREEWNYWASEERKQAIDHQLDIIFLSLQQEAVQHQLQLKKRQLEELNRKKQSLEFQKTLSPEEQYRDLLKAYETRLQTLKKVRLTPNQVQRLLQKPGQMSLMNARNRIELMAQGHYILGLLTEIERQIEIDPLLSQIEIKDADIRFWIAAVKKNIFQQILSKGKSEGWNLREPIGKKSTYLQVIPGTIKENWDAAVGLKDILTNEQFAFSERPFSPGDTYIDRRKDMILVKTYDGRKITEKTFSRMGLNGRAVIEALETAGVLIKYQGHDSYALRIPFSEKNVRSLFGGRSKEVVDVLKQAEPGQEHFAVRRAVDSKFDPGVQDVLHLPPIGAFNKARFINLLFEGDDWLLATYGSGFTQFYGPVADKMGITGNSYLGESNDIVGDIDGELLIIKHTPHSDFSLVKNEFIGPGKDKFVVNDSDERQLLLTDLTLVGTITKPIKVSEKQYILIQKSSDYVWMHIFYKIPAEDASGKYQNDFLLTKQLTGLLNDFPLIFSNDRYAFVVQDSRGGQWRYWGDLNDPALENLRVDSPEELRDLEESPDGRLIYGYREQLMREAREYVREHPSLLQELSPSERKGFSIPTSFGEKDYIIQGNGEVIEVIEVITKIRGVSYDDLGLVGDVDYAARLSAAYRIFDPAFDDRFAERIDIRTQRLLTRLQMIKRGWEVWRSHRPEDMDPKLRPLHLNIDEEYRKLARDFVSLVEDMNKNHSAKYFDRNIFLDLGRELMEAEARKHTQSIFAGSFHDVKFKDGSYFHPLIFYEMLKPWDLGYLVYPIWQPWIEEGNSNINTRITLDPISKFIIDDYLKKLSEVYRMEELKISPVLYSDQAEQMKLLDQLLLDGLNAPDDQRQRVEEYRKKVIQVLDEVRGLILETEAYQAPQDFGPFFEALHEITGNDLPFDVELTKESKDVAGYALIRSLRSNWSGFDVARDLSKWNDINAKLTEILGKDFHGTQTLNVPSSLLNEVGHDWLAWIMVYLTLTALSHMVALSLRHDFDLKQKSAEEIAEDIWSNNPWFDGIGLGTEEGVKDIIRRLVEADVDPIEEQKNELEEFKKSLSEKERVIVDGILLLAFDRPGREGFDVKRALNVLVPWFGTTWMRKRPNFFQRQTMNSEIADYFKNLKPDVDIEQVMNDLKVIVEKSAEFQDQDKVNTENKNILDPESFKQALMAKFMSTPKVIVKDPVLKNRGEDGTSQPQPGYGDEFSEHHDYKYGDDPRNIDWRASARTGKVMVKQFNQQAEVQAGIVIDLRSIGTMDMEQWMNEVVYSIKAMKYETRHGNGRFDYRMMGLIFLMPDGSVTVEKTGFGQVHVKTTMLVGAILKKVSEKYAGVYQQIKQRQELNLPFYNADQNRRYQERTEGIFSGSEFMAQHLQKAINASKLSGINVFMAGVSPESRPEIVQQFYHSPVFSWNDNQARRERADKAMVNAAAKNTKEVGGIHLGKDYDFEVEQNDQKIKFHFESDVLRNPDFSGFRPVFLKAIPLSELQNSSSDWTFAKH